MKKFKRVRFKAPASRLVFGKIYGFQILSFSMFRCQEFWHCLKKTIPACIFHEIYPTEGVILLHLQNTNT